MAYQVLASLASAKAVLDAFATFAQANGWTLVYRTDVDQYTVRIGLRIPGVTDYIHLTSSLAEIRSRISIGYAPGEIPAAQPGAARSDSVSNALNGGAFPRTWMFANGTELDLVILRPESPSYCHIAIGALTKYGSYAGGTYADGTYFVQVGTPSGTWDSGDHALFGYGETNYGYLRADCASEGRTEFFHPITNRAFTVFGDTAGARGAITGIGDLNHATVYSTTPTDNSTNHLGRLINATDDNVFSGRTFLHPIEFMVRRAGEPPYFSPVGYVQNRRYCWLANYDPEQEIDVGGETWKLFPVVRRGAYSSVSGAPNASRECAFAIRKVT